MDAIQEKAAELAYLEGTKTSERVLAALEEVRPRLLSLFSAAGLSAALVTGLALNAASLGRVHLLGYAGIALIVLGTLGMAAAVVGAWMPQTIAWGYHPLSVVEAHVDTAEEDRTPDLGALYVDLALAAGQFVDTALAAWRGIITWVRVALWGSIVVIAGFACLLLEVVA